MTGNVDNMSSYLKSKTDLKRFLDDNKEIINITPEEIKLEELELPKSQTLNPISHSFAWQYNS